MARCVPAAVPSVDCQVPRHVHPSLTLTFRPFARSQDRRLGRRRRSATERRVPEVEMVVIVADFVKDADAVNGVRRTAVTHR